MFVSSACLALKLLRASCTQIAVMSGYLICCLTTASEQQQQVASAGLVSAAAACGLLCTWGGQKDSGRRCWPGTQVDSGGGQARQVTAMDQHVQMASRASVTESTHTTWCFVSASGAARQAPCVGTMQAASTHVSVPCCLSLCQAAGS